MSAVTSRDPEGRKFVSIIKKQYNKAGLSEEEAQRVNDTAGLAELIEDFINGNRVPDDFKYNKEVKSAYGYPSGYTKPKGITEQTNILRQMFPWVGFTDEKLAESTLPANTEGWFAIPKWQSFANTYGEGVQVVLDKIKEVRNGKFKNHMNGQLGQDRFRQSTKSMEFFQRIGAKQKGNILAVAAQFGIRHRGRSVHWARKIMSDSHNEFGLGAFAIGIMLLTHTDRLQSVDDLWIDCAGDEYNYPGSKLRFGRTPGFRFDNDDFVFDSHLFTIASERCGSASGFIPEK